MSRLHTSYKRLKLEMPDRILIVVMISILGLGKVSSEEDIPDLRVKIGNIRTGVNISEFDVSENEIVVERGNTVEFICTGVSDIEWEYKDDIDSK